MGTGSFSAVGVASLMLAATACAQAEVKSDCNVTGAGFAFASVPLPANNDAATTARFAVVDGALDRNGASLDALHDGAVPAGDDQPSKNVFFQAGTAGGRLRIDLGQPVPVRQVCTYSWHGGSRGPQVYALYGADGTASGFAGEPKRGSDPAACGWRLVARVDTRPKSDEGGGQYGVSVACRDGSLGTFRYLLFDVAPTETRDPFGQTFYSEIDVIAANGPAPTSSIVPVRTIQTAFASDDGATRFVIDSTAAPDLTEWSEKVLKPVVAAWYPKLVALLASDGYQAPSTVALRYRDDMGGTPASASRGGISLNAEWFRREKGREAAGSVVHEMVHIVQDYGRASRVNPKAVAAPGWVVEGIADYVRWFLYEPQTHGAEITRQNLSRARYDGSYRTTANFLDWVARTADKDLVRKLNAAAREGRYDEALWKTWTGKSVQELGDAWRRFHAQRLEGVK